MCITKILSKLPAGYQMEARTSETSHRLGMTSLSTHYSLEYFIRSNCCNYFITTLRTTELMWIAPIQFVSNGRVSSPNLNSD